ncbi:MAG: PAS domain S-box protein, partial [Bdellovibrionales bacterium]|nr:PAS domain S-box protein [Bdellovibrionales bacterium]
SQVATKDLWRLITVYSTLGVLALSLFCVAFTAIPFYSVIVEVNPGTLTSTIHERLFEFIAGTVLLTLLGTSGIYLLVRDLVDHAEEHRKEVARGKILTQTVVGKAPDGIIRLDTSGNILGMNPTAEKIFRRKEEEVCGGNIADLIRLSPELTQESSLVSLFDEETKAMGEAKPLELIGLRMEEEGPVEVSVSKMTVSNQDMYVAFVRDVSERQKSKLALESSLQEKELLLKEVHHRVKNNLQVISSLLKLQRRSLNGDNSKRALIDSQNRIQSMAILHELLYRKGNLSGVCFGSYLQELSKQLIESFGSSDKVSLEVELKDVVVDLDQAIPCGLIVNELVTNSLQHAFPEDRNGVISIGVDCDQEGKCKLEVRDNGIGVNTNGNFEENSSLGTRLVLRLAKQIRADVKRLGPPGFGMRISFKIDDSRFKEEDYGKVANISS